MAWLSNNSFSTVDPVTNTDLNNLANDDRAWGGDVNGGGHRLSNVILDPFSQGITAIPSPIVVTPQADKSAQVQLTGTGTGNPTRWVVAQDGAAESGGNTGSNFRISRYNDAGTLIDSPMTINRATGAVTIAGLLNDPTTTKGDIIARGAAAPPTRLQVGGANNMALVVDSAATLGIKWTTMTAAMVTNAVDS